MLNIRIGDLEKNFTHVDKTTPMLLADGSKNPDYQPPVFTMEFVAHDELLYVRASDVGSFKEKEINGIKLIEFTVGDAVYLSDYELSYFTENVQ